jgi:hypothetical protein
MNPVAGSASIRNHKFCARRGIAARKRRGRTAWNGLQQGHQRDEN